MRRLGQFTPLDFLAKRYESERGLRIAGGLIQVVLTWFYIIPQFTVGGILVELTTGIPFIYAVIIMCIVYIVYTFLGGMWAVAYTDVVQGLLLCSSNSCRVLASKYPHNHCWPC